MLKIETEGMSLKFRNRKWLKEQIKFKEGV